MYTELNQIKEQLFDAPVEVKQAFNSIVEYFDGPAWFVMKVTESYDKNPVTSYKLLSSTNILKHDFPGRAALKDKMDKWAGEVFWMKDKYKMNSNGALLNLGTSYEVFKGPFKTKKEAQKELDKLTK